MNRRLSKRPSKKRDPEMSRKYFIVVMILIFVVQGSLIVIDRITDLHEIKQRELQAAAPSYMPSVQKEQNVDEPQIPSVEEALGHLEIVDPGEYQSSIQVEEVQQQTIISDTRPKIVIIIDDMGVSRKYTNAVIALPGPLTLAFLPYAPKLAEDTEIALNHGHELIIHTPMEPKDPDIDLGPIGMRVEMSNDEIAEEFIERVLPAFEGYKGINNHMGSLFTEDAEKMGVIMEIVKDRNLYFVDSKTTAQSTAKNEAFKAGIDFAQRDVFLDHFTEREEVEKALGRLERIAREDGVAIAIGHPKEHTLQALKDWLPGIEEKGFNLVPASAVVKPVEELNVSLNAASAQ